MKRPISDPFGPPDTPGVGLQTHTFQCNLWSVFFGNLLLALVLVTPLSWLLWTVTLEKYRGLVALLVLGQLMLPPIAGVIGALLAPVKVNGMGIYGAPVIGFIEWSQMRSCRMIWMGTWYVRVKLDRKFAAHWVPLSLHNKEGFALAVKEMAPIDNPLRLTLQKWGC